MCLPNLPQLLPIWVAAIQGRRTEPESEIGTSGGEREDKMAFSTCCSFKWVPPTSRAGAIIQLPACTQAKPARLVHLHKRQPRRVHMQTHTHRGESTHTSTNFATHLPYTQAGSADGFKRGFTTTGRALFEVPVCTGNGDKSDLSPSVAMPSSKAALEGMPVNCRAL